VSQAPIRADDYDEHGKAFAKAMIQLNRMTDEGVSWSGNERNSAFLNLGCKPGSPPDFANISAISGFDFIDDARALASIDWDFDGDLDLFVTNRTGPRLRLLQNNSGPQSGSFVLLSLQGTTCNRDAIGARVEIELQGSDGERTLLMRTLYAGHGFLSQSSKWLHFGLGADAKLLQVTVRWPDDSAEQFSGVTPDGHFQLIQGSGTAQRWDRPQLTHSLSASPNESPPLTDAVATRLERPIPLPPIACIDQQGKPIELSPPAEGPVLLNLWATWCQPCVAELAQFTQRASELRALGLDIVAVNVERLAESPEDISQKAQSFLDKMQFPFRSTVADEKMMDLLHLTHKVLFVRPSKLPIPSSLLIDRHGRIVAIYRGPISVDRLLEDVRAITDPNPDAWKKHSRPFAGRWFGRPDSIYYVTVAKDLIERDYIDDAERYLLDNEEWLREEKKYPGVLLLCGTRLLQAEQHERATILLEKSVQRSPDVAASRNNLAVALLKQRRFKDAQTHLLRAVDLKPDYADAHMNLARIAIAQGRYVESLSSLDATLKLRPSTEALLHKGITLIRLRRWQEAKTTHQLLLQHDSTHVQAHVNLGGILATLGEFEQAIGHYEAAMKLDPERASLNATIRAIRRQLDK